MTPNLSTEGLQDVRTPKFRCAGLPGEEAVTSSISVVAGCLRLCRHSVQGLWPNYIKVVPSIALAFTTYELLKEMMGAFFSIGFTS